MKCREIVQMIDLGYDKSLWGKLRLYGHLLHCHACRCYLDLRQALRQIAQRQLAALKVERNLTELNEKLVQIWSQK